MYISKTGGDAFAGVKSFSIAWLIQFGVKPPPATGKNGGFTAG
jgi:hypothetical protein